MSAVPSTDQNKAGDEIDLLALAANLWAGKHWILLSAALAVAIGVFIVLRATPIYQANALIQLETRMGGAMALPEGMQALLGDGGSGAAAVDTETEILRSRMVVSEAVLELDLQTTARPRPFLLLGQLPARLGLPDPGLIPSRAWGNEAIEVNTLRVPDAWIGAEMELQILAGGRYSLALPDGRMVEGEADKPLRLAGEQAFLLDIARLEGPAGRQFLLSRISTAEAVEEVQQNLAIASVSRNASMLRLTYKDPSPQRAERVLNAIARAYVAQNISRSAAEAENSLRFIEEQLPAAREALDHAQQVLNAFRQQQGSVDVEYETRSLLERATWLEAQLSELALREEDLRKRYTTSHPTYQLLLENRASLEKELELIRKDTASLPDTQKEIFNLSRDLAVAEQVYTQMLNRSQELQVLRASTVGSVRVIDSAYSDGKKIAPKSAQTVAIFLVLGLMTGTGLVMIRRLMRRGIRGAEEIEQIGIPVFGTLSFAPAAVSNRKSKGFIPIHALQHPDDPVTEGLRSLRTSLHFGMLDATTNSINLTSAAPGAGKSFTAINLAVVAAQAGQKVALIDADLRRGYLRRYLRKEKNTPGLAEYLARSKSLEEVLIPGPVDGLSVILTGRFPPNPSELLMRQEFSALIHRLNETHDLIIIDSPPTLAVTDPVIVSRYAGASIVVARHMETELGEVEAVRHAFERAGSKLSGAVLNGYRQEEAARYGGRYQYYNYRYSYQSEKE